MTVEKLRYYVSHETNSQACRFLSPRDRVATNDISDKKKEDAKTTVDDSLPVLRILRRACEFARHPRRCVSIWGFASMGSGFRVMIFSLLIGWLVDRYLFQPTFVLFGILPMISEGIIWFLPSRAVRPSPT